IVAADQYAIVGGGQQRRLEQALIIAQQVHGAKSAFRPVDLLRDYQSLLKPALLTTADNGVLICCNNLAKVSMDD
ncbi:hypothetical protein QCD79_32150, partial [Pseudomonas quasicaspiana]|nr:hypothetical protein [Pseudomonas quasicaspiana]